MDVRLVSLMGKVVPGRIVRVMASRVQVKCPNGLLHYINRTTGAALGRGGQYSMHDEDCWLMNTDEAEAMIDVGAYKHKKRTGFAKHWDV